MSKEKIKEYILAILAWLGVAYLVSVYLFIPEQPTPASQMPDFSSDMRPVILVIVMIIRAGRKVKRTNPLHYF